METKRIHYYESCNLLAQEQGYKNYDDFLEKIQAPVSELITSLKQEAIKRAYKTVFGNFETNEYTKSLFYIYGILNSEPECLEQDELDFIEKIRYLTPNKEILHYNDTIKALMRILNGAYGKAKEAYNFIEYELLYINEVEKLLLDNPTERFKKLI